MADQEDDENEEWDIFDDDDDDHGFPGIDDDYEEFPDAIGEDPWGGHW